MEVGPQLLVPGVQHEREADLAAQLAAAELQSVWATASNNSLSRARWLRWL